MVAEYSICEDESEELMNNNKIAEYFLTI